jgi:hypothetical protein
MADFTVTKDGVQITTNCKLGFSHLTKILYIIGAEAPTDNTKWQTLTPFEPINTTVWVKAPNGDVVVDKRDL